MGLQGQTGRNPLFDVVFSMFDMENGQIESQDGEDQEEQEENNSASDSTPYLFEYKTSKFDLLLHVNRFQGRMRLLFEYSTRLFKRSTIEEISKHYMEILQQVVENPGIQLKNIEISYDLVAIESTDFQEDGEFGF